MDQSGVTAQTPKSPWGSAAPAAPACSLAEVMSEQLAKQLDEENAVFPALSDPAAELLPDEAPDTTSDLMLAQMLQMQFDREFDDQLRREEKKFNGDSKVSISFENYRMVHPYDDSDSSGDEVDWQDTRHDPYRADKPQTTPRKGFTGKGKNITTKHDEVTCGRKNTARMDNEQAVDPRTRLLMYKMVNAGVLENINGCISTGKESVVFHADGGSLEEQPVPDEVVLKVFKTTLNEFKNRDRYIKDDYRFKDRFSKLNPRKIIRLWAEKEMHNLGRMKKAEIPCPEVVLLKKHILVMSFIGKDHVPAPKLKDAMLNSEDLKNAYYQVLHVMQQLYQECNLVHADLSEYNMLWHEGKVWLIDVSQSVEPTHPHGLEFLFRDCRNVSTFFQKRGVSEAMSTYDLFNAVTGLNIPVGAEDEAEFMAEIVALEKRNEDHIQKRGKKTFPVTSEDGGPPLEPDADD
uniref:Serine/threonine-protein kinase RIO3 n=1 Tax=Astatotilapia calliptera TaxID=8154 RepID=A0AAX7UH35_ASTCA